jgi:hypothetical protein
LGVDLCKGDDIMVSTYNYGVIKGVIQDIARVGTLFHIVVSGNVYTINEYKVRAVAKRVR